MHHLPLQPSPPGDGAHVDDIDAGTEMLVLQSIVAEWEQVAERSFLKEWPDPWGVWIARHDPLPARAGPEWYGPPLHTPPCRAWFLDGRGLRERNVWEYVRFWVVQIDRPWCQRVWTWEPNPLFGRLHEIGRAAFAAFGGPQDVYVETTWGSLWARGAQLTLDNNGQLIVARVLWIS